MARLRALVRRVHGPPLAPGQTFAVGDVTLNFTTREVRVRGEVVRLTSTEYRLLEVLARHAGTVLPHRLLLEKVWGPEYSTDTHYLKGVVRHLRQKLGEDPEAPRYIQTEWGIGYRFIGPQ